MMVFKLLSWNDLITDTSAPRSGMFSVVVHALLMLWGSVDVVVALAVLVMVPVPVT